MNYCVAMQLRLLHARLLLGSLLLLLLSPAASPLHEQQVMPCRGTLLHQLLLLPLQSDC
jgi:hypothetical protein